MSRELHLSVATNPFFFLGKPNGFSATNTNNRYHVNIQREKINNNFALSEYMKDLQWQDIQTISMKADLLEFKQLKSIIQIIKQDASKDTTKSVDLVIYNIQDISQFSFEDLLSICLGKRVTLTLLTNQSNPIYETLNSCTPLIRGLLESNELSSRTVSFSIDQFPLNISENSIELPYIPHWKVVSWFKRKFSHMKNFVVHGAYNWFHPMAPILWNKFGIPLYRDFKPPKSKLVLFYLNLDRNFIARSHIILSDSIYNFEIFATFSYLLLEELKKAKRIVASLLLKNNHVKHIGAPNRTDITLSLTYLKLFYTSAGVIGFLFSSACFFSASNFSFLTKNKI